MLLYRSTVSRHVRRSPSAVTRVKLESAHSVVVRLAHVLSQRDSGNEVSLYLGRIKCFHSYLNIKYNTTR